MYYALIMLSVVVFSTNFALNDIYRRLRGNSLRASLDSSFIGSIVAAVALAIINGLKLEFTVFTFIMALLNSANGFLLTYCSLKALGKINLSLYTLFMMLGGMALPFLQGILFYDESITLAKCICFVLICISLLLTVQKGKKQSGVIYYIGIFVLNGLSGILSKIFTSAPYEKTSPEAFQMLICICSVVISFILLLSVYGNKLLKDMPSLKAVGVCGANTVLNRIANLWLVIALMHVDTSVQYPMVTGGTIIISTVICFFTENKPTKKELISVSLAFLGNNANRLRISKLSYTTVEPGKEWESSDFIMTPHKNGWAKGIISYRNYATSNIKRCVEIPERILKTLGYRTVWISEQYIKDPDATIYKYSDFPTIAKEMKEHGLTELSVWGGFEMNLPLSEKCFRKEFGGIEEWKKNVNILREMGIHVTPLVSWLSIWSFNCERYGLAQPDITGDGWGQNTKAVPMFRTPYIKRACCHFLEDQNTLPLWREDIRHSLAFLRDKADTPDITWDQYLINPGKSIYQIIEEYRRETLKKYPDAAFSSESTHFYEADIDQIDYTWDWEYWPGVGDCRPYMNVVRNVRPNMIVDSEPLYVKYSFMDNYIINAYPSKPHCINGSAMISDYPEYSKALKQCAALREKFLNYFLNAELIGECILKNECKDARISGYTLDKSALIFAVKYTDEDAALTFDLSAWCGHGNYNMTVYNADGEMISTAVLKETDTIKLRGKAEDLFTIELKKQ